MSKKNTREASTVAGKSIYFIIFLLFPFWLSAQEKLIQGLIIIDLDDASPEGIVVKNSRTKNCVISDESGKIRISVILNDILYFSSELYENNQVLITEEILNKGTFQIYLEPKIIELNQANLGFQLTGDLERDVKNTTRKDSISIIYKNLGIQEKDVPPPNPNGQTVEMFKATDVITLKIGKIIGELNGYNRRQRNKYAYDAEQNKLEEIQKYFGNDYLTDELKIPFNKIKEFIFFVNGTTEILKEIKDNDFPEAEKIMKEKAEIYLLRLEQNKK